MERKVQERAVVLPSGDLFLEGLYHRGDVAPAMVVGAPHPRFGGNMHSPVVAELAFAAARDRHPTLRFNYRGVGGSHGKSRVAEDSEPALCVDEVVDFRAAIDELRETSGKREMVAAGYSFGAAIALEVALSEPGIVAAVLIAPPNRLFRLDRLSELRVPTLIVGGADDQHIDWPRLSAAVEDSPVTRIEKVPDTDHFFLRGLVDAGRLVQSFLASLAGSFPPPVGRG